jgi:antitoxin HicB
VNIYQEFEINYFQDEDGMFTAEVPAIPGCVAWGKTLEETHQNTVDAIESCLEVREKIGSIVPKGTLRSIIRKMNISVEEFAAL